MKINQYAVYRVDMNTPGRKLWHHSFEYANEKKIPVKIEYYKQYRLEPMKKDDSAFAIWNRAKDQFEISDVIVTNKDGEIDAYYVCKDHVAYFSGFVRLNTSGTLISMETANYTFDDRKGTWMATDFVIIDGKQYFLLEHEKYGRQAPGVILDAYGKLIVDKVKNGLDDSARQLIKNQIHEAEKPKVTMWMQGKQRLDVWQKYFENGEYLRSVESGEEANYDMVDGRVNNEKKTPDKSGQPKSKKKRESVINKFHKKQIEIVIRSGKPVPKYLEQNRELNRR